ncbi:periplasmic heavy metal sensor [Robbsia andropogonis]|uniref:periplasmic heavy metal sensor n=1 Tax=Robbsia andropogonis TaxID=28092 RepID=UPI002A6A4402|nr:periplasmic heavy metal sensor [Robbsia andropogonis]
MLKKTRTAFTVAAAMLTLGVGAQAAHAQDADSAPTATTPAAGAPASNPPGMHNGPHGPRGDRHGPPRGPGGPGGPGGPAFAHMMDRLHASLHLNATQEAAWQNAQTTSRQNFDAVRTQHEIVQKQLREASQQPILDLGALQAQRQQLESNDLELRNGTEKAFVDFYNTLDDQQKKLVSDSIKQSWKRMMEHGRRPPPMGDRKGDAPPPRDAPPDAHTTEAPAS